MNLTEFCRSLFAEKWDPKKAVKEVIKSLMKRYKYLVCMKSAPTSQAEDNIQRRAIKER